MLIFWKNCQFDAKIYQILSKFFSILVEHHVPLPKSKINRNIHHMQSVHFKHISYMFLGRIYIYKKSAKISEVPSHFYSNNECFSAHSFLKLLLYYSSICYVSWMPIKHLFGRWRFLAIARINNSSKGVGTLYLKDFQRLFLRVHQKAWVFLHGNQY